MIARGAWFAAGVTAGVYAVVRARRVAEAFTPDGARDRLAGLRVGARMLAEEFSAASAEREVELRERLGLVPHGVPELTAGDGAPADPVRRHQVEPGTISAAADASVADLPRTHDHSGAPRPAQSPQEGSH